MFAETPQCQLETVRSSALEELRMLLLLSDFSTMSTSMPSSSGAEETGEEGVGREEEVVEVSLMLRSMGDSV